MEANSASSTPTPVARPNKALIGYIAYSLVALILLVTASWFAFFSVPEDAPLHSTVGMSTQMLMAEKVTILKSDGSPVNKAIVVLDNNQQILTDENGVANFEDLMLHDHFLDILYSGEHYHQRLHVHSAENQITLGMSLETRRSGALLFSALLFAWLILLVLGLLKKHSRRSIEKQSQTSKKSGLLASPRRLVPVSLMVLSFVLVSVLLLPLVTSLNNEAKAAGTTLASLPVPTGVQAVSDDMNAILTWNGGPDRPDRPDLTGATGYKISWGLAGQPLTNVQVTTERILQLQPLINGQPYQVSVQSVDNLGNVSNPSAPITFTGSNARVAALRAKMTGFFDDFNLPAGAPDELKWNSANSGCNDAAHSAFFINTQFHAHSLIGTTECDRGQMISRPRGTFDFTGRTGAITFDFDGEFRRGHWYLDVQQNFMDISGHVNLESESVASNPSNVLRFHQNEQSLGISYIDGQGMEKTLAKTDWNPYPPLDWAGLNLVPNVRRHWELQISQSSATIVIDGKAVLKAPLNLPFSKATVLWNEFGYNTAKTNEEYILGHWDNFGFDGPPSNTETHNYRTAGYGGSDFTEVVGGSVKREINIPDQLNGATAQRLMFTMQMKTTAWGYNPGDKVLVNGTPFAIPQPTGVVAGFQLISNISPYSMVMALPGGVLKTGINTFEFFFASGGITNVHTELDFTKGAAPAYTQPYQVYPITTVPTMPDIAPGASFQSVSTNKIEFVGQVSQGANNPIFPVSGKVSVQAIAHNEIAFQGSGKNPGIARVELWLDHKPIWTQDTGGTPVFNLNYTLDTTLFPNGQHELFFVAFNPKGTISLPDYFQSDTKSGDYYPVKINITNTGVNSKPLPPTATPLPPTATPTPVLRVGTPTPTPIVKPTQVPTTAPATTKVPTVPVSTTWQFKSAVSGSMVAGSLLTINSNFTSPNLATGPFQLDVEVYNLATGQKVAQWTPVQSFTAGQTITVTNSWKPGPGKYQVRLGAFKTNWSFIAWLQDGAIFTIK